MNVNLANQKLESVMNDLKPLPAYANETLAHLSHSGLIDIIIEDADRVPRNVIDECELRGDEMTEYLYRLHTDNFLWSKECVEGLWWLRLHVVVVLGFLYPSPSGRGTKGEGTRVKQICCHVLCDAQ